MDEGTPPDLLGIVKAASAGQQEQARCAALWQQSQSDAPSNADIARRFLRALMDENLTAQAEAAAATLNLSLPDQPWLILSRAKLAFGRKDYDSTLSMARAVLRTDPSIKQAWSLALGALRLGGQAGGAEDLARDAIERFPNDYWAASAHAEVALTRGDNEAAAVRFAALRRRFPKFVGGYIGAAKLAQQEREFSRARALLEEGLAQCAGHPRLVASLAALDRLAPGLAKAETPPPEEKPADAPGDPGAALQEAVDLLRTRRRGPKWYEAFAVLQGVHGKFPRFARAYVVHVEALIAAERWADAVSLARQAQALFPRDINIGLMLVAALNAAGELPEALEIVGHMAKVFPNAEGVKASTIHVLADAGRDDEAEALATSALAETPDAVAIWREYARVANRRGDWAAALARWEEAQRHRPTDKYLANQVQLARLQLCVDQPPEYNDSIFARFESLGGDHLGCEFGMMQKQAGSEAVGLLRWAAIKPDKLIEALDSSFEGMGSEAQTSLTTNTGVYGLRDTRYGLYTHTFVNCADAPFEKMLAQSCRRMRFLANKLNEDLEAAEKIFVYKATTLQADAEFISIFESVRRRGGTTLLCIALAHDEQPKGSVRSLQPGLFIGYVGFFMQDGKPLSDMASYHSICAVVAASTPGRS